MFLPGIWQICQKWFVSNAYLIWGVFCPALTMSISVCVCVVPVLFSKHLIGRYTRFWKWFWHPIYPTRCFEPAIQELGWAMSHLEFLAWRSSASLMNMTRKLKQSLKGSQIWILSWPQNKDNIKNLGFLKMKKTSKIKATSKMQITSKMKTVSKIKTTSNMKMISIMKTT